MKRLQNKIAQSRAALPVTAVYALAVWLMLCTSADKSYAELIVFALSAYLMAELNTRNTLIRVYSRMVSCVFLVLGTMTAPDFGKIDILIVQLCYISAYLLLFSCYQEKQAQGRMFYSFACIGIASIIFPQALIFVPVIWILTGTNLMAFSARNFWASLIGLTAPYWFYAGYCALTGNFNYIDRLFQVQELWDMSQYLLPIRLSIDTAVSLGFIVFATAIGAIHFLRNSYMDKIRTRMIYEFFIIISIFIAILIVLQPQHTEMLTALLTINASVLAGHFIALTYTRLTNITFCILVIIALAVTAFNILYNYVPTVNNLNPWSI